jgi:peptide/nickel transport system substrate-binding protein
METTKDKIVAVDDLTVRFEFANPNPMFLALSRGVGSGEPGHWAHAAPHFLKQYHPDFTQMEQYSDPKEQFQKEVQDRLQASMALRDIGRPVLWPFVPVEYVEAQVAKLERNPYYYTVDRWGQQLPYVDYWENQLLAATDKEVILLKLIAGETHWERRLGSVADVPFLREQAEDTLDLILTNKPEGAQQGIYFSAHHENESFRELLRTADFRRALSVAIDRETINQTAYLGLGTIGHGFSLPGVFDPEIDGVWVQYDPDLANQMLDDLGLTERDSEGYRLLPSGENLTFILGSYPTWHPGALESAEISMEGWNAIGIRTTLKSYTSAAPMVEDWNAGLTAAYVRSSVGGDIIFDLNSSTGMRWGSVEYRWFQTRDLPADQRQGVEPPEDLLHFLELGAQVTTVLDEAERERLLDERRRFLADSCWVIGMVQSVPHLLIANKKLRGVWGRTDEVEWQLGAGDEDYWVRSWFWEA